MNPCPNFSSESVEHKILQPLQEAGTQYPLLNRYFRRGRNFAPRGPEVPPPPGRRDLTPFSRDPMSVLRRRGRPGRCPPFREHGLSEWRGHVVWPLTVVSWDCRLRRSVSTVSELWAELSIPFSSNSPVASADVLKIAGYQVFC